jgi:hypothetical protein
VLVARALDRERARGDRGARLQRTASHEKLAGITREFFRTLAPSGDRAAYFAPWPTGRPCAPSGSAASART